VHAIYRFNKISLVPASMLLYTLTENCVKQTIGNVAAMLVVVR